MLDVSELTRTILYKHFHLIDVLSISDFMVVLRLICDFLLLSDKLTLQLSVKRYGTKIYCAHYIPMF